MAIPHTGLFITRAASCKSRSSVCVCNSVDRLFSSSPGQAPYGARSACAKRAAYQDPHPVAPHQESLTAQAAL